MFHTTRQLVLLTVVAASAVGCQSRWFSVSENRDAVTTNVHVTTTPAGALVSMDDIALDNAPFTLPVEYEHREETWRRQTNAGAVMRERTGLIGTVLLFPFWLPASLFHTSEDTIRHTYSGTST